MLTQTTLSELQNNSNTGIEYEIALFINLVSHEEQKEIERAISSRYDNARIAKLHKSIDISEILTALTNKGLRLIDCSFETQNDAIGPSDLVMTVQDNTGALSRIGLSVKYENLCTKNCTGRNFISTDQQAALKRELPIYTKMYVNEMTRVYGKAENWFRKGHTSHTTDKYIDLIRDAVIANWKNLKDKTSLFDALFQADSPIEYWVCKFKNNGKYELVTTPAKVQHKDVPYIVIAKHQTSYIGFYLQGKMIAKMQVKFNNGFIEGVYDNKGKRKRKRCDFIYDGIEMVYGKPFGSWNFSVIH